jgi:glycyl-tRNA synthetase beta chain
MPTLLLELFSEEIPSRMQRTAAEQLQRLVLAGFEKNGLKPSEVKTFVSPRHLAIQCFGLPAIQPDVKEERRGPKIGAPEQALKGFLQSTGLTLEQCEQRDGYYYATIERKGRAAAEVIKEIVEGALSAFVWPKSMKWGARPMQWVRPLHSITCLLDDAVVPVQFGHLTASNITHGHRFLAPAAITIPHAEKYESLLLDANVMVDFAARRTKIAAQIAAVAAEAKLSLHEDDALLDEVTGLVEWPVPLLCEFDAKFLDLPPEVLISEMKNHQRYFALYAADGKLTNRFITVANMVNTDGGARVKDGNGRVVRARLADGEFYWNQDRLTKLEDWGKKLSDVVFHAKVGMMDAKVERIEALASDIADAIGFEDKIAVRRAAQLCKADLTSGMVGEFPELQGIMGRYYAKAQGKNDAIAEAIYEHYKPQGAGDDLPKSDLGAILSVADKLDSIISLFAAGEKPTGSKDPLALRRAALGVLRIMLHFGWQINLEDFFVIPAKAGIPLKEIPASAGMTIKREISEFFRDRLQNTLREEGIRHDAIEAIVSEKDFNPLAIANRTRTLATWLTTDAGKAALAAIKRSMNILAAEEKKSKTTFAPSTAGAVEPAEKAIAAALARAPKEPKDLEALTAPINQFFTDLMVTEEGKRDARLSLLAAVRDAAKHIADFSKIEG